MHQALIPGERGIVVLRCAFCVLHQADRKIVQARAHLKQRLVRFHFAFCESALPLKTHIYLILHQKDVNLVKKIAYKFFAERQLLEGFEIAIIPIEFFKQN